MKYNEVAGHFSRAKYPSKGKPMQSNVRIHMEKEGSYVLKLHGRVIIRWHLDGVITNLLSCHLFHVFLLYYLV